MACPRCGASMPLDLPICPHCRFSPALGEVVDLRPPAGRPDPNFEMPPLRRLGLRIRPGWRWWQLALFALLPGLGHLVDRRPRLALLYCLGVAALVAVAIAIGGPTGLGLGFGLAASLHAWSIFDLTPWRRDGSLLRRIGVFMLIQVVLYAAVYRGVAYSFITLHAERRFRETQGNLFQELGGLLVMLLIIGASLWIARRHLPRS